MKTIATSQPHAVQADYYEWLHDQARALRGQRPAFLDWRKLAEELEEMGARERRELVSHLRILMAHMLKWTYQSYRRGETSWKRTIVLARQEAAAVLADSPSLKPMLNDCVTRAYEDARRLAGAEMKLERQTWQRLFPVECPWTLDQLRDPDYLPRREARR
jgi:hypothetical protein